jgi:hypothetical protein
MTYLTVEENNGDHFWDLCLLSVSVAQICKILKQIKMFFLLQGLQRLFTTEVWLLTILKTRVICAEAIFARTKSSVLMSQWTLEILCTWHQWIKCHNLWPPNITRHYLRFFWVKCKTFTLAKDGTSDGTTTRVRCLKKLSTSIWLKIKPAYFPAFAWGSSQRWRSNHRRWH